MLKHKFFTLLVALCATTALWASDVITYTATKKLTETTDAGAAGLHTNAFNVSIRSHTFSNGVGTVTFAGEVTRIGDYAFYGCSALTSVTIPNSVTSIGNQAFRYCSGLTKTNYTGTIADWCKMNFFVSTSNPIYYSHNLFINDVEIKDLVIPEGVDTIGRYAFYNCSGLTSVTIGNSVTSLSYRYAFEGCKGLKTVTLNSNAICSENYSYKYNIGSIFGSQVKEYIIGNSVTEIGYAAFQNCDSLTSITIPNSVTSIDDEVFRGCKRLTKTNYTGTIADWCKMNFYGYTSNPIYYSHNLFINDVEIKDLVIPEGVDTIGDYAFEYCDGLTSVTIPNSVTTIGDYAFYDCDSLTSVTIGNSVTEIGKWAFKDCSGLTSITIPNSVETIGGGAFEGCSGLTSITCEATTPPTCGYSCFFGVDKSIPLYVPAGSVKAYKAADEWKGFTNIRPITAKDVEVTEIESTPAESAVEIAWPSVVNAETYTIEIRLGDQLICSIVFNAQGQLVSINFNLAPGRGGHTYATTAEGTATGWAYTIAGLNPGTNYTYSVIAKNADGQVIDTKSGIFSTRNTPTDIDNMGNNFNNSSVNPTKSLRNGQVIIRKNNKTYNTLGQEL